MQYGKFIQIQPRTLSFVDMCKLWKIFILSPLRKSIFPIVSFKLFKVFTILLSKNDQNDLKIIIDKVWSCFLHSSETFNQRLIYSCIRVKAHLSRVFLRFCHYFKAGLNFFLYTNFNIFRFHKFEFFPPELSSECLFVEFLFCLW